MIRVNKASPLKHLSFFVLKHLMVELPPETLRLGFKKDFGAHSILDVVSTLIAQYEESMEPLDGSATPPQVLKYLMEEHGLTQSDLKPQLGGQGVASEILSGQREINAKQARKLAERFSVSVALFI